MAAAAPTSCRIRQDPGGPDVLRQPLPFTVADDGSNPPITVTDDTDDSAA